MNIRQQFTNAYRAYRTRSKQYNSNWRDYRSLYVYSGFITVTVFLSMIRFFTVLLLNLGGIPYLSTATLPLFQKSIWILLPLTVIMLFLYYVAYFEFSVILLGIRDIRNDEYSLLGTLRKALKATIHSSPLSILLFAVNLFIVLPLVSAMYPSDIFSSVWIPEYITEFMLGKWYLLILLILLVAMLFWLALRCYLVIPLSILRGFPTKKAFSVSASMMKGHKRKTLIQLIALSLLFITVELLVFLPMTPIQRVADYFGGLVSPVVCIVLLTILKLFAAYYSIRISIIMITSTYPEEMFEAEELHETKETKKERKTINKVLGIFSAVCMVLFAVVYSTWFIISYNTNEPLVISTGGVDGNNGIPYTISAMQRTAISAYPDYTSVTVQQTKDGHFAVIGFGNLMSYCNSPASVKDLTLSELTALEAVSGTFTAHYSSLDDYLDAAARIGQPLILELEDNCFKSPEVVQSFISQYGRQIITEGHILQSGYYETVQELLYINEEIVEETGLYDFTFSVSCSLYNSMLYPAVNTKSFAVEDTNLPQMFINKGKVFSQDIFVWNVNSENSMDKMILMNVDGIYTSYPSHLRKRIESLRNDGHVPIIRKFIYKYFSN